MYLDTRKVFEKMPTWRPPHNQFSKTKKKQRKAQTCNLNKQFDFRPHSAYTLLWFIKVHVASGVTG